MVSGGLVSKVAGYGEPKIIQVSVRNWDTAVKDRRSHVFTALLATLISSIRQCVGCCEGETDPQPAGDFRNGSTPAPRIEFDDQQESANSGH